jgi:hypothetical protein
MSDWYYAAMLGRNRGIKPLLHRTDPKRAHPFSLFRRYGAVGLRFTLSNPASGPW